MIRTKLNRLAQALLLSSVLVFLPHCTQKQIIQAPVETLDPLPIERPLSKDEPDPMQSKQWALSQLEVDSVWSTHRGSRTLQVMLIGTGIDYNHEDLRGNVAVNQAELQAELHLTHVLNQMDDDKDGLVDNIVGWDFVDNDGFAYDRFGQDTQLAGIIGAIPNNGTGIRGIVPEVSLYPVRYINSNGLTSVPKLLRALEHAARKKPHVILLNLAIKHFDTDDAIGKIERLALHKVLDKLQSAQIPLIVGAGNLATGVDGTEQNILQVLSMYDNIFMVTSHNKEGQKPMLANFSPMVVHTAAPGEGILTTATGNRYETITSTQAAAAHVAGALALAIAKHQGQLRTSDYFNALLSSTGSTPLEHFAPYTLGRNRLNIKRFLSAL